ncbi:MAG TPA: hypothetical protein VM940_07635 [Chthoniobacterales bacterium]|jgi:hypothetical protein|nr:hypothetical protein [Chthoniobacterales bacterium]
MNKRAFVVCLVFVAASLPAADSSAEEKVKTIRSRYAQIEKNLKSARQVTRDLPGESAEGGELKAYFKDRAVEKLSATFLGETGEAVEEYYFWNSELIFVFRVESHYTKPMSGIVKNKTEERFYFADGKLIRWVGNGNKPVSLGAESEKRAGELQESASKYKALANK